MSWGLGLGRHILPVIAARPVPVFLFYFIFALRVVNLPQRGKMCETAVLCFCCVCA